MSYLAKNCLNFLLFQKVLNFDVLNGSFSEGKIVNMIQVDCSKFEMMFQNLGILISMSLYLVIGTVYMGVLLGFGTCLAFFIGFFAVGGFLFPIFKGRIIVQKNLMMAKDKRIAILKNVVQNVAYVKMRAWELFYSIRIFREREKEMKRLFQTVLLAGILIFTNWFARSFGSFGVLFYKTYLTDDVFPLNEVSAFQRIQDILSSAIINLPFAIQFFFDLKISL